MDSKNTGVCILKNSLITILYRTPLKYGLLLCFLALAFPLNAKESTDLETISLQLKWKHAFQFAGYYAAIEKGYYHDAGLNVVLKEHDGTRSPVETLLAGHAQYAVTGSDIALHRAQGEPVIALASIFQHSPYAFLVKDDSGITKVEDFKGKRIMMFNDDVQDAELLATLHYAGLTKDDYIPLQTNFDPLSLERGETDVFNAYVSDQGFSLQEKGMRNRYLMPRQYGVDFYGDVLVTTEDEVNNNAQRVQSFLKATLQGWEYALQHPNEIINLILKKYNTQNLSKAHLVYEANASRELIQPLLVQIGYMNADRWEHIKNIFVELKFLDSDSSVDGMIYQEKNEPGTKVQWAIDNWLTITAVITSLFIFILLLFNFQLRRLVKKRTKDLQQSEQHWRELINAGPVCIKTLNRAGELMSMNTAGLSIIDADDFKQVKGVSIYDLIDVKFRIDFLQLNKKVFNGIQGSLLFKVKTLKGRDIWLETTAVPYFDSEGNITRSLGVTQDVTDRIDSETEKERLQNELQMAQKMEALGRLTGGIAHDFNNLLGVILGYSGMALSQPAVVRDEKLVKYINNIHYAGDRAKDLVAQMMAFSRNDKTKYDPIQLHTWIKEDIKLLRSALPSSIKIKSDLREDLPAVVLSPTQLNQIIMNLSINAKDAMDGQGLLNYRLDMATNVHLSCDACHKTIHGDWIELSITDTGTGIEPEIARNMFTPFFTTKEVGKGSGMGLAVIYGIAHNNGGHIIVDSKKDEGTTFRVLFPICSVEDEKNSEPVSSDTVVSIGNGEHILIVDDEPALALFLEELLNLNGYRTTTITDSLEALRMVNKHTDRYSLLITDQTMPNLTGLELTQKVRDNRPEIPVIMCSGYSEKLDVSTLTAMDIKFVEKPIDTNQFLELVHDTVNNNQGQSTVITNSAAG